MNLPENQRLRCPCCGEVFALTADLLVADAPAAPTPAADAPVEPTPDAATSPVPITVVFDGGSIGNPGRGYGSYQLTVRGKAEQPRRLEFGDNYTNNEAEYDTLIAALDAIIRRASDPQRVQLTINGDSQLVIRQLKGEWKVREPRLQERVRRAHALLAELGSWQAIWHPRAKSVRALGH